MDRIIPQFYQQSELSQLKKIYNYKDYIFYPIPPERENSIPVCQNREILQEKSHKRSNNSKRTGNFQSSEIFKKIQDQSIYPYCELPGTVGEIQGYGSEWYLFGCLVKASLDSILRMILKKEKGAFKHEKLSCRINWRFW